MSIRLILTLQHRNTPVLSNYFDEILEEITGKQLHWLKQNIHGFKGEYKSCNVILLIGKLSVYFWGSMCFDVFPARVVQ